MRKAKKQNLPLIMFSTYHSAEKIEVARKGFKQPISVILNDEAHYLVQEQFHDILRVLISSRCYFFTATTIQTPSDEGRGMNNADQYGKILYSMSPREAIEMGRMVRPRRSGYGCRTDVGRGRDGHADTFHRSRKTSLLTLRNAAAC